MLHLIQKNLGKIRSLIMQLFDVQQGRENGGNDPRDGLQNDGRWNFPTAYLHRQTVTALD